jgi:hypothetical protein
MSALKDFFDDKQAQLEWAQFINDTMSEAIIARVYAGKDVTGYKEARAIITASFKKLNELFQKKPKPQPPVGAE